MGSVGYELERYDRVLLVASWGLPERYMEAEYYVEVETVEGGRTVVGSGGRHQSSVAGIKAVLEDKLKGLKGRVELLVFAQDTVLLNELVKDNSLRSMYFGSTGKSVKRTELLGRVLSALYGSNEKAARELDASSPETYGRLVRPVPGVLTVKEGAYLYTWRGERAYDVAAGLVALATYCALRRAGRRVAVLLDTTHGVNYFIAAVKEGVMAGALLHAFESAALEGELEELAAYHYNSDPVEVPKRGIPSLKVHLLRRLRVAEGGKVGFATVTSTVEGALASKWPEEPWEGVGWRDLGEVLALYSRGALAWALRKALDVGLPEPGLLAKKLERLGGEVELEFKKKGKAAEYAVDYKWGRVCPAIGAAVSLVLVAVLRRLADELLCGGCAELFIERVRGSVPGAVGASEEVEGLAEALKAAERGGFKCFRIGGLAEAAKRLYGQPHLSVNEHELEELKDYLKRRPPGWNKLPLKGDLSVYKGPGGRAFFAELGDLRSIVSAPSAGQPSERDFYAHAGLAYGLRWFAFASGGKEAVVCLGDPSELPSLWTRSGG